MIVTPVSNGFCVSVVMYKYIISIVPDIFKRHLEPTVRLDVERLCSRGKLEHIIHQTCVVTKRCSHTRRNERIVAVMLAPFGTVKCCTVAQSSLMEAFIRQCGVVGCLTVHIGILDPLEPFYCVIGSKATYVGAILTIVPHRGSGDRCTSHTEIGVYSTVTSSVVSTAPELSSVAGEDW